MRNSNYAHLRYYRLLSIAKKQLDMDEDSYRSLLARCGAKESNGKVSATSMTIPQLEQAVNEMKRMGFRIVANPNSPSPKQWGMFSYLLTQNGYDGDDDPGFLAFMRHTVKTDDVKNLSRKQMSNLITGLQRRMRTSSNKEETCV